MSTESKSSAVLKLLGSRVVFPDRPKAEVTATISKDGLLLALAKITVDDVNFDPRHWCLGDVRLLERATSFVATALQEAQERQAKRPKDMDHAE